MKNCFIAAFTLFLLAFAARLSAQTTVQHSLHHAYTVEAGVNQLILDLGSDARVEMRQTKGSRVVVEATVSVTGLSNEKMLAFLVEQGRYSLAEASNLTDATLRISANHSRNVLMVKGQQCKEEFSYVIYVPASIKVTRNVADQSSAQALPTPAP